MPNRNKSEPHAVTTRFSDHSLQRIVATAKALGLTRHKTLPLCFAAGLEIIATRAGIPAPAAPSSKEE